MSRYKLLPIGFSILLVAIGWAAPVIRLVLEGTPLGILAVIVGPLAALLALVGVVLISVGIWRRGPTTPPGARMALLANMIFLGCFALEISDGLVRRGGVFHWFSTGAFVLALILFIGNLAARPWAWWACRIFAALGIVWFLVFAAIIPVAPLQTEGTPVPWYGRVWMIFVSLCFAGVMTLAFRALGRQATRNHYRPTERSLTNLSATSIQ